MRKRSLAYASVELSGIRYAILREDALRRLCRRAGIRVETLNRVERGRTTPDFATVRKLVVAIRDADAGSETL
jgi:transcriptional regulator with XRE-family HTH domain